MSIRLLKAGASLALVTALAAPSVAQNINGRPNYGTVNLRTGFARDPHIIPVRSGGNVDASRIDSSCRGNISASPDVRLNFVAGSSLPLIISAASRADTTLVINAPDGRWYCDDDGGQQGMNPSVRFNRAQTGRYEIWVGTYGSQRIEPARLHISEVGSQ